MNRRILSFGVALVLVITMFAGVCPRPGALAMTCSQTYVDLLKSWEGFTSTPYKDNTHYSIGYGSYCPDDKVEYYKKNPITVEQGEQMLKEQLGNFEQAVNNFINTHGMTVQQHQFDALVSFTYNCGSSWMSEMDGYFNVAAREMDMGAALIYGMGLWSSSGGEYILVRRRMREANMFINGVYGVWPDNYRYVFLDGGSGTVSYKICCFDINLQTPINVAFKSIPTGKDSNGNPFAYTFAGWYTADGRKVEVLDSTLTNKQTLYAKWADPQGNIVTPPVQTVPPEASFPRTATVINVNSYVNARVSSDLSSKAVRRVNKGETVTVVEQITGTSFHANNGSKQDQWCRLTDNTYVPKFYLQYNDNALTSIQLIKQPTQTEYAWGLVSPKLEGSVLLATYANGYSEAMTVKKSMISGFNGKQAGQQNVTITYGGKTTTLAVNILSPVPDTITSDVYSIVDGSLTGVAPGTTVAQLLQNINEREYITVFGPTGEMTGDDLVTTDTMLIIMDGDVFKAACAVVLRGDVNCDGAVDGNDATLLLQYAAGWEVYVPELSGDVNGDGAVDGNDATLLLQYAAGWEVTITQ